MPLREGPLEAKEGLRRLETQYSNGKFFDFKPGQGLWNLRKSTLQNPMSNTPGAGTAKNEGFQAHQNLVENYGPKPVGMSTGDNLVELQGAARFLEDSLNYVTQSKLPFSIPSRTRIFFQFRNQET